MENKIFNEFANLADTPEGQSLGQLSDEIDTLISDFVRKNDLSPGELRSVQGYLTMAMGATFGEKLILKGIEMRKQGQGPKRKLNKLGDFRIGDTVALSVGKLPHQELKIKVKDMEKFAGVFSGTVVSTQSTTWKVGDEVPLFMDIKQFRKI